MKNKIYGFLALVFVFAVLVGFLSFAYYSISDHADPEEQSFYLYEQQALLLRLQKRAGELESIKKQAINLESQIHEALAAYQPVNDAEKAELERLMGEYEQRMRLLSNDVFDMSRKETYADIIQE